ncbi:hypothetical protein BH24ACT1_BH24ACT1_07220 [soil metagenome]
MTRPGDGDRMLLALIGLVTLAAGSYGLARHLGAFGTAQSDMALLTDEFRRTLATHAGWVGGGATFVALVLAWWGWRWLRRQLVGASSPLRQVRMAGGGAGHTSVDAGAVAEAVVRDMEALPHVTAGRVRLVGHERVPTLELVVDLAARADLEAVRRHVEDHVLPRARTALEREELEARVRLRLGDPASRTLE